MQESQNTWVIDSSTIEELYPYIDAEAKSLFNTLQRLNDFIGLKKELKYIICLRYAVRLILISRDIIGLTDEHHEDSFWRSRAKTKNAIMTFVYMSTPYGRKNSYFELIKEHRILPNNPYVVYGCRELTSFLELCTTSYLTNLEDIPLASKFLDEICQGKPIVVSNRNFKMTLHPTEEEHTQIQCPAFTSNKKRPPQLNIKVRTTKFDNKKLRSMLMANLVHLMDSDLMHHFVELCIEINSRLNSQGSSYQIIFERNHDCYILNCGFLLDIILEECYLRFNETNYMDNFSALPENVKSKFQRNIYLFAKKY